MFANGMLLGGLVPLTLVHRKPDMSLVAEESWEKIPPTSQRPEAECDIERSPALSTYLQASLGTNQPTQTGLHSPSPPSETPLTAGHGVHLQYLTLLRPLSVPLAQVAPWFVEWRWNPPDGCSGVWTVLLCMSLPITSAARNQPG